LPRAITNEKNRDNRFMLCRIDSWSSIPTLPRAIRDSISETQRFASAFIGCRDAL
jgi:hypothetical protein